MFDGFDYVTYTLNGMFVVSLACIVSFTTGDESR